MNKKTIKGSKASSEKHIWHSLEGVCSDILDYCTQSDFDIFLAKK